MGDLITRLTSLFNLTKTVALTLPGLVGSMAVVILLWPPMPVTLIPQVPVHAHGTACPPIALTGTLLEAKNIDDLKETARRNQDTLEKAMRDLQECSEYETSQVGREETLNANLKADITVLEKEQASIQDAYITYQKANSPLTPTYSAKLTDVTGRIARKRSEILLHEQAIRDKNRNMQEIARHTKMVTDRLADPGRAPPAKDFRRVPDCSRRPYRGADSARHRHWLCSRSSQSCHLWRALRWLLSQALEFSAWQSAACFQPGKGDVRICLSPLANPPPLQPRRKAAGL